jgi:hypothetical protein
VSAATTRAQARRIPSSRLEWSDEGGVVRVRRRRTLLDGALLGAWIAAYAGITFLILHLDLPPPKGASSTVPRALATLAFGALAVWASWSARRGPRDFSVDGDRLSWRGFVRHDSVALQQVRGFRLDSQASGGLMPNTETKLVAEVDGGREILLAITAVFGTNVPGELRRLVERLEELRTKELDVGRRSPARQPSP